MNPHAEVLAEAVQVGCAIRRCDSWSTVNDLGAATKDGRYSVTVFFDTEYDAKLFELSVQMEVNGAIFAAVLEEYPR